MVFYLCRYRKKKEQKEQEPVKLTCGICGKIQIGGLPYEYVLTEVNQ
jgi:hypothetical protein